MVCQTSKMLAGIAESLNGHTQFVRLFVLPLRPQIHHQQRACTGGLLTADGAPQPEGFTGNDTGNVPPGDLGVFIHHPAHDNGVGIDVGCGNIAVGSDHIVKCPDVAT